MHINYIHLKSLRTLHMRTVPIDACNSVMQTKTQETGKTSNKNFIHQFVLLWPRQVSVFRCKLVGPLERNMNEKRWEERAREV